MRSEKAVNLWRKACQALSVAELAYKSGFYDEAVCRTYFAVLKAALALLASLGLQPKTPFASAIGFNQILPTNASTEGN